MIFIEDIIYRGYIIFIVDYMYIYISSIKILPNPLWVFFVQLRGLGSGGYVSEIGGISIAGWLMENPMKVC
jgi:hypothetical protein